MSDTTKTVLIVGGVLVGTVLLMRSSVGQAIGIAITGASPISTTRNTVRDARIIAEDSKGIFDTAKSFWNGITGGWSSTSTNQSGSGGFGSMLNTGVNSFDGADAA